MIAYGPPQPDIDPAVFSQGTHKEELLDNLASAPADQIFTPLLVDAKVLPSDFRGSRMIPVVTYGVETTKPQTTSQVEILPGTHNLLNDSVGSEHFNPHLSIRARAHNLTDQIVGEMPRRTKTTTFGLPSYVFNAAGENHLFIGGTDSDTEAHLTPELSRVLAEAYNLGSVVVGHEVEIGSIDVGLQETTLPSLVREIGHNISQFNMSHSRKVKILKDVEKSLSDGKSPDYRPYLKSRKGWPKT